MIQPATSDQRPASEFHTIYILGGHKLAFDYSQKILAARQAKQISFDKLALVDPDANCYAASQVKNMTQAPQCITKSYHDFILDYSNQAPEHNILIPDHTAPHVMLRVFMELAKKKLPSAQVTLEPFELSKKTPFLKPLEGGAIWATSYATWMCPPDCAEPAICPHTQGIRDWDFNKSMAGLIRASQTQRDNTSAQQHVYSFSCQPLIAEIAHIPFAQIATLVDQFTKKILAFTQTNNNIYVATHSHCHGIVGRFLIHN